MSRCADSAFEVRGNPKNVVLNMQGKGFLLTLHLSKVQWRGFVKSLRTSFGNADRRPTGFSFSCNRPMIGVDSIKGYRKLLETVLGEKAPRKMADRDVAHLIPREFILEYNGTWTFISKAAFNRFREACLKVK